MDQLGDIGLTISFDQMKVLDIKELGKSLGRKGTVYVITTVLDGSGKPFEYMTKSFEGIKDNDFLPLGDGGMLVASLKNPRWFLDVHMLVMESDSDIRDLGRLIDEARKESKLDDLMKSVGAIAQFDPSGISRVSSAVDLFLSILVSALKANKDDHIATIHDFYLKHQGFGRGRHPKQELRRFQDVEVAYNIDLTQLE
jgi:hypothetical protein